eukprot:1243047-Karenia_brevis.AAC.1
MLMGIAAGGCLAQDRLVGPRQPVACEGCETLGRLTRASDLAIAATSYMLFVTSLCTITDCPSA